MMKKQIAGLVLAVSVVGGVGAGVLANALTSDEPASAASTPTTTATPAATSATPAAPASADDLLIAPGEVGPVKAGMTKDEALKTGLFDADVPAGVDGCPLAPLEFKKAYAGTFDVITVGNGEVTSIGVRKAGPTTESGLGVGSTYGELRRAIDDVTPVEAGYGQAGVFQYDAETGGYVGYLFDTQVATIEDPDPVTFIEVTKGAQPGLMRDGC